MQSKCGLTRRPSWVAVQGIDIDTAEPRNGEKLRLEDLRRRDGSDNVRRNGSKLCNVFRPIDRLCPDAGNCFLHSSHSIGSREVCFIDPPKKTKHRLYLSQ